MIVTVTFNPALDYFVTVDKFQIAETNRTTKEQLIAGGKGINVSLMLARLNVASTALGFSAGFTGEELIRQLQHQKIDTDFIQCRDGMTRINVKINSEQETEINGRGPVIGEQELAQLKRKIEKLTEKDILVLSGNVPSSVPCEFIHDLLEMTAMNHVSLIVDSDGFLLRACLEYHPLLIKPNELELSHIINDPSLSLQESIARLKRMGAENILLSLGKKGSLLFTREGQVYRQYPVCGKAISSIGAGDAMVAGYIAGWIRNGSDRECLRLAAACGSATAFTEGIASKEAVEALLPFVEITEETKLKI